MTRTRWRSRSASACITRVRGSERQSQGERGAVAGTGALGQQGAAQGLGGERTAVQSETVAVGAGGEAVAEDALEVLPGNSDTRVDHGHEHRVFARADPHRHRLLARALVACVLGVTNHVHEDLKHLVLVDLDWRYIPVVVDDRDAVAAESSFIHL